MMEGFAAHGWLSTEWVESTLSTKLVVEEEVAEEEVAEEGGGGEGEEGEEWGTGPLDIRVYVVNCGLEACRPYCCCSYPLVLRTFPWFQPDEHAPGWERKPIV